jgi:hypothetical protein
MKIPLDRIYRYRGAGIAVATDPTHAACARRYGTASPHGSYRSHSNQLMRKEACMQLSIDRVVGIALSHLPSEADGSTPVQERASSAVELLCELAGAVPGRREVVTLLISHPDAVRLHALLENAVATAGLALRGDPLHPDALLAARIGTAVARTR